MPDPAGGSIATLTADVPGVERIRRVAPAFEAFAWIQETVVGGRAQVLPPKTYPEVPGETPRTVREPSGVAWLTLVSLLVENRYRQLRIVRPRSPVHVV